MTGLLLNIINTYKKNELDSAYRVQKQVYGLYVPPTLKQVLELKELVIKTGLRKEMGPDELLGLSKIECKILISELKKISHEQEKNALSEIN